MNSNSDRVGGTRPNHEAILRRIDELLADAEPSVEGDMLVLWGRPLDGNSAPARAGFRISYPIEELLTNDALVMASANIVANLRTYIGLTLGIDETVDFTISEVVADRAFVVRLRVGSEEHTSIVDIATLEDPITLAEWLRGRARMVQRYRGGA